MQQQPDFQRNPKAALWRFVGVLAGCALFYGMRAIDWPGAGFIFWVFVVLAAAAFLDVIRAHRAWKITQELHDVAARVSTRHDTNPPPELLETDKDGFPKSGGW